MNTLSKLVTVSIVLLITGCAGILGVTGADTGKRISDDWVEYNVTHPGLTIKIIEPYAPDLMPISTVGKSSPSPLRHTIIFGTKSNQHELEVIGKYKKELYFDNRFYGSIWSGDVLIRDGSLSIDGKLVSVIEN
ncbi:hypothetical protein [Pseudoalteromonas sp. H71]|uniref:hypothetical protein n=1 Tax=Pseudoalteromonas sp. H71 TaxID=1348395 RepID=UPI00073190BA|nr:hypothetical protein [Pseudoalteromonas sp. H71]KTD99173.1 hypothetical protein ATS71_01250 [Pseudoalteromonas sp. H71]|tara:strand:- start:1203 stop:1604 length:402 start_codon:yes stop_codon:yes gene_type:complete